MARFSGNDKSPFIVLLAVVLLLLLLVGALAVSLRSGPVRATALAAAAGAALPLIYTVVVVFLSRRHLIDSLNWLGFR